MLDVISSIIQVISWGYIVVQLKGIKINIKSWKNILLLTIMILTGYIILQFNFGFSKTIIIYSSFTICFKYIYSISFYESSILNFIGIFLHFIGEIIIVLSAYLLPINIETLNKYLNITPLSGLIMFLVIILIFLIFKPKLTKVKDYALKREGSNIFYIIIILCFSILFSIHIST